jgi:hypothetical protein
VRGDLSQKRYVEAVVEVNDDDDDDDVVVAAAAALVMCVALLV